MDFVFYTDGACSANGQEGSSGGWAWHISESTLGCAVKLSNSNPVGIPNTTNNVMELMAVVEALKRVDFLFPKESKKVEIRTDSQLVIGWLELGWKRNQAHLLPLLNEADALLLKHDVTFTKVKGHSGDANNTIVDRLAVAASQRK